MKRGTPRHPKTLLLAGVLNIPRYAAVGLLESLWHFGQSYAQAGDIGRYSDEVIAEAVGWEGNAATLVSGFVKAGWADRCRCHRVRIHDWPAHADQTVERWLKANRKGFIKCYDDASSVLAESQHETSQPASDAVPSLAKPSRAVVAASAAPAPPAEPEFPSKRAANVYHRHYPDGAPPGAMFKALRPLVLKHGWEAVEPELDAYLTETEIQFQSWPKFAAGYGKWANGSARAPANGKARQRLDGINAFIRGGLKHDGRGLDRGHEGASDAALAGHGAGDGGVLRRSLPEAPTVPDGPPVAPRGGGGNAA